MRTYFGDTNPVIEKLIKAGILRVERVNGGEYLLAHKLNHGEWFDDSVRFLSPFDPLVWDRLRFENLLGWQYRFEAYVPKEERVRGFYAMPMLWRDSIVGWVNIDKEGNVEPGFVESRPKDKAFEKAYQYEVESIHSFLKPLEEISV